MDRQDILNEIRKNAAAHGGQPVGAQRFARETGISEWDWAGKHWARWSDALREAGFGPNSYKARFNADAMLAQLVAVTRRLGRIPTVRELLLHRCSDATFPSPQTLRMHFGHKAEVWACVRDYCRARPDHQDVLDICGNGPQDTSPTHDAAPDQAEGSVYLLKSERFYKVGRTACLHRRTRELAIQLPEKANLVHAITTDDPVGIEAYWHRRFALRRRNGEFFALSADDVRAFRRWRRI
jgi:hypothetical protein